VATLRLDVDPVPVVVGIDVSARGDERIGYPSIHACTPSRPSSSSPCGRVAAARAGVAAANGRDPSVEIGIVPVSGDAYTAAVFHIQTLDVLSR